MSPTVRRAFTEFEVDPSTDLLEVTPPFIVLGTSSTSGPTIDLDGATTVPGLYAAGYGTACPHLMSGISGSGISSFSAVAGVPGGHCGGGARRSRGSAQCVGEPGTGELRGVFRADASAAAGPAGGCVESHRRGDGQSGIRIV